QKIDPAIYSPKNLAKELKRRGRIPVTECVHLSLTLTEALEYLHGQQLIHRDIKPSNIIFVNDRPKFADIGLVTNIGATGGDVTFVGHMVYTPPEGRGSASGVVYSLGRVLYEISRGLD